MAQERSLWTPVLGENSAGLAVPGQASELVLCYIALLAHIPFMRANWERNGDGKTFLLLL